MERILETRKTCVRIRQSLLVLSVVWLVGLSGCSAAPVTGTTHDAAATDAATVDAAAGGDGGTATDAASGSDAAVSPPEQAIHATSGWQVYADGSYHYGPSIIIDADQSIHMWTCSPGTGSAWDFIRYSHSTDGGHSWTGDIVALQPTAGTMDAYSTCDPGAVKIGNYWYIGYTSTTNSMGLANDVFLARASAPTGPFLKWSGTGWADQPQPIVTYTGDPSYYGFGEPSLVLMGKKLFVYYSDDEAQQFTNVATVDDATTEDWPAHLVDHGHAIARLRPGQDSADVKYVDALGLFMAVTTYDRFGPNASIAAYQSLDGLTFTPAAFVGSRVELGAHNVGISGDAAGHFDVTAASFIAYAYQPAGNGWGNWPTFLDPIRISAAPGGTPVAGEVSSIVGGNQWDWSGPRAWDGDPATVFSSDSHGAVDVANEWVMVDLGGSSSIQGVTLVPRSDGTGFPIDFSVQSSPDGSTWTDVPGQTHTAFVNPGGAPVTLDFVTPVSARWLRLYATRLGADGYGNHYLQLAELTPRL